MTRITATIFALLILLPACGNDPAGPHPGPAPSPFDATPRENSEAESMALYISGELIAPQGLYDEIVRDLAGIRVSWVDSVPDVAQSGFTPPWVPGELRLWLTEEATTRYRQGTYDDLDSLHAYFRLTDEDSVPAIGGQLRLRFLFEGKLHPERLVEAYEVMPSISIIYANSTWNNQQNVYPWMVDNRRTYLFRWGWGDCPAGCIDNRFSYFKTQDVGTEWVGTFVRFDDPEPGWWAEGRAGWACYHGRDECPE
jgi:hypothetical protein